MAGIVLIAVGAIAQSQLPAIGAGGLLHPFRRSSVGRPPDSCDAVLFDGANVQLKGWRCRAAGVPPPLGVQRDGFGGTVRRGTLVYLHGIADNRASAVGIIDRFSRRGFDVIERAPLFFTPNAIRRPSSWRKRRVGLRLRPSVPRPPLERFKHPC